MRPRDRWRPVTWPSHRRTEDSDYGAEIRVSIDGIIGGVEPRLLAVDRTYDGEVWCPLHRELGVTNEQWQRLEPRLAQFHQTAQAVCRQTQAKRAELVDLIAAGTDRTAIAARQEEILAGQRRMQELVIEQLRAEKEVLTAEQQRKLFDMIRAHSGCTGPALLRGGLGESSQTSAGNDQ